MKQLRYFILFLIVAGHERLIASGTAYSETAGGASPSASVVRLVVAMQQPSINAFISDAESVT